MDEKDLLETNEQEVVEDVDTAASDAVEQELTDAVVCDNCEESDEYKKYQVQNLSPVEEEYLKVIKETSKTAKKLADKK